MTPQKYLPFAACLVVAAALLGAGCGTTDSAVTPSQPATNVPAGTPTTNTPTTPPTTPDTSSTTSPVVAPPSADGTSIITASSTLDTTGWETYTNKTLGYSFKYPVRGRFAPQFEVQTLPVSRTADVGSCINDEAASSFSVNGNRFCVTARREESSADPSYQERWISKKDNWYIVITFTKKIPADQARTFDSVAQSAQIATIMSTFQLSATN